MNTVDYKTQQKNRLAKIKECLVQYPDAPFYICCRQFNNLSNMYAFGVLAKIKIVDCQGKNNTEYCTICREDIKPFLPQSILEEIEKISKAFPKPFLVLDKDGKPEKKYCDLTSVPARAFYETAQQLSNSLARPVKISIWEGSPMRDDSIEHKFEFKPEK